MPIALAALRFDHQLGFRGLFERQVARFRAFDDLLVVGGAWRKALTSSSP